MPCNCVFLMFFVILFYSPKERVPYELSRGVPLLECLSFSCLIGNYFSNSLRNLLHLLCVFFLAYAYFFWRFFLRMFFGVCVFFWRMHIFFGVCFWCFFLAYAYFFWLSEIKKIPFTENASIRGWTCDLPLNVH